MSSLHSALDLVTLVLLEQPGFTVLDAAVEGKVAGISPRRVSDRFPCQKEVTDVLPFACDSVVCMIPAPVLLTQNFIARR